MQTLKELKGNPLLEAWLKLADPSVEYRYDRFKKTTWKSIAQAMRILDVGGEPLNEIARLQQSLVERPWPRDLGDGSSIATHSVRRAACDRYAWAIPSNEALDALVKLSPLVEIGAGAGYWARLLHERGANVVAFDNTLTDNHWHDETGVWYPVLQGGIEQAAEFPDHTLFLCWPPYAPDEHIRLSAPPEGDLDGDDGWYEDTIELGEHKTTWWKKKNTKPDMALEALLAYETAGGQRVAYVGEGHGGCTAGDQFHTRLGLSCWHDEGGCTCDPTPWKESEYISIPQWDGINDGLYIAERSPQ
jgi:hypothetical protein